LGEAGGRRKRAGSADERQGSKQKRGGGLSHERIITAGKAWRMRVVAGQLIKIKTAGKDLRTSRVFAARCRGWKAGVSNCGWNTRVDIALLVSNVQMPGMTGPELAKELRRSRPDLRVVDIRVPSRRAHAGHGLDLGPSQRVLLLAGSLIAEVKQTKRAQGMGTRWRNPPTLAHYCAYIALNSL
jgi:CheY-like chemotaxis protein